MSYLDSTAMRFSIDGRSPSPPSEQIADQVRFAVAAGRLEAGERLPSVRSLASEVRVNPNTVSRAWRLLEREGLIEAHRGMGIFVTASASERARAACESIVVARVQRSVREALDAGVRIQLVLDWVRAAIAEPRCEEEAS